MTTPHSYPQIITEPPDPAALRHGWTDPDVQLGASWPPAASVPPQAERAARLLAQVIIEILMGGRSPQQLARWLDDEQLFELASFARPLRGLPVRLQSRRLSPVSPTSVEGLLLIDCGRRHLAAALRLDARADQWKCSQLQILLPQAAVRRRSGFSHGRP